MKSFDNLERQVFNIQNQKLCTKNFFQELHNEYLADRLNINQTEIIIPDLLIKKYANDDRKKIRVIKDVIEKKNNNDSYGTDGVFTFSKEVSYLIRDYFGAEKKKQENEEGEDDYRTEREVLGILTREEFEEIYPDTKLEKKTQEYEFVPTPTITYNDFCTISNKYPKIKFLMNPHLPVRDYSSNTSIKIQKIEIDLKRQLVNNNRFGEKITTKFSIQCKCGKSLLIYPSDIHSTITHTCGWEIDNNGNQKPIKNRLDKTGLCPVEQKEMWLYEAKIPNLKDSNKSDTVHLYAFEADISPGRYVIDVWNAHVWDNKKKSYEFYPIMLGFKKKQLQIDKDLIKLHNNKAKEYCIKHGLPYARFLDVLFSVRDIAKSYGGRDLDDRGMLLQLFITASGIAKHLNSFDKLGILSMGNKSLSKTYPSYLMGIIMDNDFQHVGSSQDISIAGVRGGIDNHALINGVTTTMFQKGIFSTAGLCLFDEGEKFFDDPDMNMVLKTFLDEYIDIKKIGGNKVEQTYTPMIMSNFPINFNSKYTKEIKESYWRLNKINDEKHEHGQSREEIAAYIADVNLYLPLSRYVNDYQNQTLAKTIAYVRHNFTNKGVDWRTGGSMPASYRLLLDVVCYNVEEHSFKDEDRIIGQTESVLPQQGVFPTMEFIETLKALYGHNRVNLKFESTNDESTRVKLKELEENINKWFEVDEKGKILFLHLSGGTIQIDPKLNGLVYTFIKTLQCFEDILNTGGLTGNFSDNIKRWVFLILSKCKRGVTKDEYDFKEHYTDIVPTNEKFSMLEEEIEKIKSMEEADTLDAKIEEHLKRQKSKEKDNDEIVIDNI